jgi:APA family basic amino acid/polyamine antiporter
MSGSHGATAWLGVLGCVGALYSIGAIAGAGKEAVFWGVVLLVAGIPMYIAVRGRRGVAQR